jgi:queuine tRNA-ribosyltransferase
MSRLNFKIDATSPGTNARACSFQTLHTSVKTPIFMPVGTQATVKGVNVDQLKRAGSNILLANTYHLLLRPGPEIFKKAGGIHRFMNWSGSVLTDSGGFQIFSLPGSRKIDMHGAVFTSYVDNKEVVLTPETSIQTQKSIGSDIMMVLDQCVPSTSDYKTVKDAMNLTHHWASRSLSARGDSAQSLFGIIQGGCFKDLRKQSADVLTQLPFDGFAIGGLAVGETKQEREDFTELTAALLPDNLPRYLMGVGTPIDLLEAVHRGVDMFDCIIPTKLAQQSFAYTSQGQLRLNRSVYKENFDKIDPQCDCNTCTNYSRAYIHHLFKAREFLGIELITVHNLHFYHNLMNTMRTHIINGTFMEFYKEQRSLLTRKDQQNPMKHQPKKRRKKPLQVLGDYVVKSSPQGFSSIFQNSSGQTMRSVNNPDEEANQLYIEQSRLKERLCEESDKPLVLWDVGLGAAHKAMSAINCFESLGENRKRPLTIISFENNMDALKLVLKNPTKFPHIRHQAPHILLKNSIWKKPHLEWKLIEGDFLNLMEKAVTPDIIFFDPFSPKKDHSLWEIECFNKIISHTNSNPMELFTYSCSIAIRTTLLCAGFYVAKGKSTGPKSETTIAITNKVLNLHNLLGPQWLKNWERSRANHPLGTEASFYKEYELLIRNHPQFKI